MNVVCIYLYSFNKVAECFSEIMEDIKNEKHFVDTCEPLYPYLRFLGTTEFLFKLFKFDPRDLRC